MALVRKSSITKGNLHGNKTMVGLYDENSFLTECQNPDREALASSTLGGISDMNPVVWNEGNDRFRRGLAMVVLYYYVLLLE